MQNETVSRESLVVLPLRDFLGCVPVAVGIGGGDSVHVRCGERFGGEEAGAGAGDCCVKGARDEDFEALLEVLGKSLMGRDGGLVV